MVVFSILSEREDCEGCCAILCAPIACIGLGTWEICRGSFRCMNLLSIGFGFSIVFDHPASDKIVVVCIQSTDLPESYNVLIRGCGDERLVL